MKKIIVLSISMLIVLLLSSCSKLETIEDPELDLFSEFYIDDEYTILKRTNIEQMSYYAYAINLKTGDDESCIAGHYHEMNYMFLYESEYYGIKEASKLGLFTCSDLRELKVLNSNGLIDEPNDSYEDSEVNWIYLEYIYDYLDMESVDEVFSYIFIGIISKLVEFRDYSEQEIGLPIPYTLYEIEILSTIKGTTSNTIKLIFYGGYSVTENLTSLQHGSPLPLEGEIYLFTAVKITDNSNPRHEGADYLIGCPPYEMFKLDSYNSNNTITEQVDSINTIIERYLELTD